MCCFSNEEFPEVVSVESEQQESAFGHLARANDEAIDEALGLT